MPRPMTGGDDAAVPERPALGDPERGEERDRSGRELAMRLPEWDLVPPTEFLDRSRPRPRPR